MQHLITRTIYGNALQPSLMFDRPYVVQDLENADGKCTLNHKFGIHPTQLPGPDERHAVRYYAIGIGGHRAITGANGIGRTRPRRHDPTDAACFEHLPFVLRDLNNDLTVEQRKHYAGRRIEQRGGATKVAYYLKRLATQDSQVQSKIIPAGGGTSRPFVPTTANLNPVPLDETGGTDSNVVSTSGDKVSSSLIVNIDFNAFDAAELRNVARIIYGDESYALVSEIAICAGVDRVLAGQGPGNTTLDYLEAIAVQPVQFISCYYQLDMQNEGFGFKIDVGIGEPLLVQQA